MRYLSRREFLRTSSLVAAASLIAACVPPEAEPVSAPAAETASPPDVQPTASRYSEAPMLAELVQAGTLPPVEERLPENPEVIVPTHEVGQYGGTMRCFMLTDSDVWAPGNHRLFYALLGIPRELDAFAAGWPQTGWEATLAEDYAWNEDATQFTLRLRKGAKWSDGEPFTTADLLFFIEDVQLNPDLNPTVPQWLRVGDDPITVSAPDDYTIVFDFPGPSPKFALNIFGNFNLTNTPKHYFSQWHPAYTEGATYEGFTQEANRVIEPNRPFCSGWVVRSSTPDGVTLARNPYFHAVDSAGNQLPYLDQLAFPMVGTTDNAILKVLDGEIDFAERNMQQVDQLPLLLDNQESGGYRVLQWHGAFFGTGNTMDLSCRLLDPEYPELREMLRTKEFRRALSIAINREEMNDTLYLGTGRPAMWGLNSSSPYWDEEMAEIVAPVYEPDTAKAWLDELDLVDRDGDGIREYPNGKPVTLFVHVSGELKPHVSCGEMVARYWQEIGIDARLNIQERATVQLDWTRGYAHARIWGPFNADMPQMTGEEVFAPYSQPLIEQGRLEGEEVPVEFEDLKAIQDQILASTDHDEIKRLMKDLVRHRLEWGLGITTVADLPYMVICSNRMGNVPEKGSAMRAIFAENPEQFYIKQ